jgi:hypothetical protein
MGVSRPSALTLDSAERQSRIVECAHCHRRIKRIMQTVLRSDGSTFGVAFASLHDDQGVRDAWLDAILGTFGDDAASDHVTFGCRVTLGVTSTLPGISLVDAATPFLYRPVMGRRLTREEALEHPRLNDFWHVVDLILLEDPEVHAHANRVA